MLPNIFLHKLMLHPLPHEIASDCLNTQAYVIPYLNHTRHQLLKREMADEKTPNPEQFTIRNGVIQASLIPLILRQVILSFSKD